MARGFSYLTLIFAIATLGWGLAAVGTDWGMQGSRERETELLFAGHEYREAIRRYYEQGGVYPRALADLVLDTRHPVAVRHLRRLYPDPVTGSAQWGLITTPDGRITGVYSRSHQMPLKHANFRERDRSFEGQSRYSDWKFEFAPVARAPAPSVGKR